jgi:competence protein ComEC
MGGLPRPVALALAATIGAQLAVAPVLIATFGELSLIAPLANVVALPAVAPATVLGLLAASSGPVAPGVAQATARGAEPFAGWILGAGDLLGSWRWASVAVPRAWGALAAIPVVIAAGATAVGARAGAHPP